MLMWVEPSTGSGHNKQTLGQCNPRGIAEQNAPVDNGTHESLQSLPGTFLTSTLPVIHDNTIIVATTHPSVETGHQKQEGGFSGLLCLQLL
ncbi:hypothetical protein GGR50DRAFT_630984 [Xylaria sp. CBS 124048]|nr:hypothetical protein GGR50DRAFT_630984 [Xylaria sp. CBS 124048]